MSYTVLVDKRTGGLLLTDKDIDPRKSTEQRFEIINGGWTGYYKDGIVTGGVEPFQVDVYRNFESVGDYNEVLWNFREEYGVGH
ncbi:hypothetical protein BJD49_gp013 [Acinetobacter phage vB_AbaM_phiAbaA1]|uniref:hypothetical protein n=1 Tax=Acinetobacter phage vB_AbaM_phiAbaA1 TaxID=1605379 RepID=UPI00078CBC5F|nr:hypothetical protein BJD49_gp013 [Acinetobacter phage vB_AbaM_phiAbaA1]AJK27116.1 hypothetical protein phiAbaA1_013 [Acinetobacter phage vB_AbaM_phiAbaA1]